jgi:LmbE family N-acetylglucosaminyl deacetylase
MSFRARLRPVRHAIARPIESGWRAAIRAGAFLRRVQPPTPEFGGQRVLVVAPHPDDEAIGCVGSILRHVATGDPVCIAIATDGRQSRILADPDAMARQRHQEAIAAARLMRVERLEFLGLPEGEWHATELESRLQRLLAEFEPDVVYAPSRVDFHPEHFAVAHVLALALRASDLAPEVRVYPVQVPLTSVLANRVVDISREFPDCAAVLSSYATQAGSIACALRQRRYCAALHGFESAAEEFWQMPAASYVSLHAQPPRDWPRDYRGLRNFPLTDPLAYWVGREARRRFIL